MASPLRSLNRTPARPQTADCRRSQAERLDTVYLRAAQAYMLISMPTGTSTIFGVFQVIWVSQVEWRDVRRSNGRTASGLTQVFALTLRDVPHGFRATFLRYPRENIRYDPGASPRPEASSAIAAAPVRPGYSVPLHPGFHPCPDLPH
jgi:hypothetical protein